MAKIDDPLDIKWRDQVGGRVSQLSRSGPQSHKLGFPRKATAGRRNTFGIQSSIIITLWRALTGPQKSAWDTFGSTYPGVDKYGDIIYWSGWNWFTRLNARLGFSNLSMILTPPPNATPSYTESADVVYDSDPNEPELSLDAPPIAGEYLVCYYKNAIHTRLGSFPDFFTYTITFTNGDGPPFFPIIGYPHAPTGSWYAFQIIAMDSFGRIGTPSKTWLEAT